MSRDLLMTTLRFVGLFDELERHREASPPRLAAREMSVITPEVLSLVPCLFRNEVGESVGALESLLRLFFVQEPDAPTFNQHLRAVCGCFSGKTQHEPKDQNRKYTVCPEWVMIDIQVLLKDLAGSAYSSAPVPTDASMPHGWCR